METDMLRTANFRYRTAGLFLILAQAMFSSAAAIAGEADVVGVDAVQQSDGAWRFSVTLRHADEGWDHYADRWDVVGPEGTVYGERVLLHPHVNEQPFTRSLSGVAVPEGIDEVIVRAHDSMHALGGTELIVNLPR
jgi:hypothetical protein